MPTIHIYLYTGENILSGCKCQEYETKAKNIKYKTKERQMQKPKRKQQKKLFQTVQKCFSTKNLLGVSEGDGRKWGHAVTLIHINLNARTAKRIRKLRHWLLFMYVHLHTYPTSRPYICTHTTTK